jgi:hypothetical protein
MRPDQTFLLVPAKRERPSGLPWTPAGAAPAGVGLASRCSRAVPGPRPTGTTTGPRGARWTGTGASLVPGSAARSWNGRTPCLPLANAAGGAPEGERVLSPERAPPETAGLYQDAPPGAPPPSLRGQAVKPTPRQNKNRAGCLTVGRFSNAPTAQRRHAPFPLSSRTRRGRDPGSSKHSESRVPALAGHGRLGWDDSRGCAHPAGLRARSHAARRPVRQGMIS